MRHAFAVAVLFIFVLQVGCRLRGQPIGVSKAQVSGTAMSGGDEGIRFMCARDRLQKIKIAMDNLLAGFGWQVDADYTVFDGGEGEEEILTYLLKTEQGDTDTLTLVQREQWRIRPDNLEGDLTREIVSIKEIIAALMQHGRLVEFADDDCSFEAMMQLAEVRQKVVQWAQQSQWLFPNDESRVFTDAFWCVPSSADAAGGVEDAFERAADATVGRSTPAAMITAYAIADQAAVRQANDTLKRLHDMVQREAKRPARVLHKDFAFGPVAPMLLQLERNVPSDHWIPGEWGITEDKVILYAGDGTFLTFESPVSQGSSEDCNGESYGWRQGSRLLSVVTGPANDRSLLKAAHAIRFTPRLFWDGPDDEVVPPD